MFTNGILCVYSITGLIMINLSGLIVGEKEERFANFYAAPGNLELIAMASDHSPQHHQRSAPPRHSQNHHQQHQPTSPRNDFRGRTESPGPSSRKPAPEYSSDEPRFSIGLGTLAPSYSQKFGLDGRTRLDFDHRANGFSYTLTNNHHPEPQQDQANYADSPQDSKSVDGNVKIYYDQRFSPYTAAETNNYFSRVPFTGGNSRPYGLHPLQEQQGGSDRFSELFAKYAPKHNEESGSPSASGRDYQGDSYNPRYDEDQHKESAPELSGYSGSFLDSASDDDGPEGYNYPIPFNKKDDASFLMTSQPEGSLEYVSRLASGPSEFNEFSTNSRTEPVVFSSMVDHGSDQDSGLDNNDAFSAYIAGLPLTP